MKTYKELTVWKKSMMLVVRLYDVTTKFPESERFGLVNQMRRAVVSIPSNIAEGYARKHTKEYLQFLYIAFGSAAELETQLMIAKELKFVKKVDYEEMNSLLVEVLKMLNALISNLARRN